ncbi:hypothetical protein LTR56_021811 [Elasticomyces elasticus]|nr:hypothetical protein LTR56_021811 [Elasticomyces elasticus]KAK3650864.1 hypothetical protein LTR22_012340 [Elasticomyces elasticus]KAK4906995.1 hypothetical protein LTR49_023916 [Elasticomyces elasticus]KAK5735806.1 hypothetical protein LTS12_026366 [Elasticomyces elasticus]
MSNPRIIIVTGAVRPSIRIPQLSLTLRQNRGIGKAICDLILTRPNIAPLKLFAATRAGTDFGLHSQDGDRQVLYPKLDIADPDSIKAFAGEVKQHGKVDVLINNAGVNLDNQYGLDNARTTLDVNYKGTLQMCQTFIPLLSSEGRIVNLSSVGSLLKPYSETLQARFRDPKASLQDLDAIADEYLTTVKDHNEVSSGYGGTGRSYSVSKALVNALTSILARDNPSTSINCCCPGWIATDMGRLVGSRNVQPPKSPEEGAKIPMRLGFADLGGVTGRYWANDSIRGRGEGSVQEW